MTVDHTGVKQGDVFDCQFFGASMCRAAVLEGEGGFQWMVVKHLILPGAYPKSTRSLRLFQVSFANWQNIWLKQAPVETLVLDTQ